MADLQSIIKKIKALRARAADVASTEAEAEIAARIAAKLLSEYNISLSELDVRAEGVGKETWDSGKTTRPFESMALFGIDKLCRTKSYFSGGIISIIGAPADVETALYFLDIIRTAALGQSLLFQLSFEFDELQAAGQSTRSINAAFKIGLARRIGERLKAMATEPEYESSGRDLVPVKNALIREFMDRSGIHLQSSAKPNINSRGAYAAGQSAGNGVSLARGVGSTRSGQLRLGRR